MSLSIWPGGHIYGPRLGIANKICSALGLFDIWPGGHIYGPRLGIANKICSALGLFVYLQNCKEQAAWTMPRRSVIVNEI